MFEKVVAAPSDPIFGLGERIQLDPRPDKINLVVGVYQDESSLTPVLAAVKDAEARLLRDEQSKTYLPIDGSPQYRRRVAELVLGTEHPKLVSDLAVCVQTPGGTGALRIAADLVADLGGAPTVWISEPTWANHTKIAQAAGLVTKHYRYFNPASNAMDFAAMLEDLKLAEPGDLVVVHGCCHNPTGVDLQPQQQEELTQFFLERRLVPLVDLAYQGFAQGVDEDAAWLRDLATRLPEIFVATSFSKTFGLYNERTGALIATAGSVQTARDVLSRIKQVVRSNYSNPPGHGAAIVECILSDPDLRLQWRAELDAMRGRIRNMRQALADGLDQRGVKLLPEGNRFIVEQRGMFSYCPLSPQQVEVLRERFGIYVLDSGRINVAGITRGNIDRLCDGIAEVVDK